MRKILWYAFLLIPAVFTSCNLEDDSGSFHKKTEN